MVNCNPETVSTDYDTSRPPLLRAAHLRGRHERHRGRAARSASSCRSAARPRSSWLGHAAAPSWCAGTSPESIDPPRTASAGTPCAPASRSPSPPAAPPPTVDAALAIVGRDRLPGARAPELRARRPGHGDRLRRRGPAPGPWPSWPASAASGKEGGLSAERPVLVDRFLEDATEVDVDAIRDAHRRLRHRRDHGARRGGRRALRRLRLRASRPYSLSAETIEVLEDYTRRIADALDVRASSTCSTR